MKIVSLHKFRYWSSIRTHRYIFCSAAKVRVCYHFDNLYGVETRVLKQAIKRNLDRFPKDFMFELSTEEANSLLLQGVGFYRAKSFNVIQVNIHIIRIFVKMRHLLTDQLSVKLDIADIKDNFFIKIKNKIAKIKT